MSGLSLNTFTEVFNRILDEIMVAASYDLQDPDTQRELKRRIDLYMSSILGIDISSPLVKPFWDKFTSGLYDEIMGFAGFTVSSPPKSVDVANEYLKEKVDKLYTNTTSKIDTVTEELKKRLQEKQGV